MALARNKYGTSFCIVRVGNLWLWGNENLVFGMNLQKNRLRKGKS